jgi:membrane protein required for beta-lactamase induction
MTSSLKDITQTYKRYCRFVLALCCDVHSNSMILYLLDGVRCLCVRMQLFVLVCNSAAAERDVRAEPQYYVTIATACCIFRRKR